MAKQSKVAEEVQGTENVKIKKPFLPIDELIGQKKGEIFGVQISSMDPEEIKRLEKGLMTDKVYELTLPTGEKKPGKIQLSKIYSEEGGVTANYKPQYEKAFIPQKTFDGYQFSMDEQDRLRNGENVLYRVQTKNGKELTKLAKLDLPKWENDPNYTNQLIVADITKLPIDKLTYGQELDHGQNLDFLSGKGAEIENPKLGSIQHEGKMTIYFDPIKGTSRYKADDRFAQSLQVSKFLRQQNEEKPKIQQPKQSL